MFLCVRAAEALFKSGKAPAKDSQVAPTLRQVLRRVLDLEKGERLAERTMAMLNRIEGEANEEL